MHPTNLRIGGTVIESHASGLTITRLRDGRAVKAFPQDDATYFARAEALGYGRDVAGMSRDHEIVHSLLAGWLGLPESPTLRGVAVGSYWPHWQAEEAAVLGVQRFARMASVDLARVAARCAKIMGGG